MAGRREEPRCIALPPVPPARFARRPYFRAADEPLAPPLPVELVANTPAAAAAASAAATDADEAGFSLSNADFELLLPVLLLALTAALARSLSSQRALWRIPTFDGKHMKGERRHNTMCAVVVRPHIWPFCIPTFAGWRVTGINGFRLAQKYHARIPDTCSASIANEIAASHLSLQGFDIRLQPGDERHRLLFFQLRLHGFGNRSVTFLSGSQETGAENGSTYAYTVPPHVSKVSTIHSIVNGLLLHAFFTLICICVVEPCGSTPLDLGAVPCEVEPWSVRPLHARSSRYAASSLLEPKESPVATSTATH